MNRSWLSGGDGNSVPERSDLDHSPLIAFYELTRACDLVCKHCRASAQSLANPFELSPEKSRQLVHQLTEFPRPPALVLTGGDPLKRADIYDLVEYAVKRRLEVAITPSATPLVTRQALARLRDAGIARLAISLDAADAATHDAIRGVPGSYEHTREIIADAKSLAIPLQINTVLSPINVAQIEELGDLLEQQNIVLWSVFFLVPVGRAAGAPRLNAVECEAAFERLWQQSQIRTNRIKTTEAPHFRRFLLQKSRRPEHNAPRSLTRPFSRLSALGINDGKGIMFISHLGLIYPSGFLPIHCGAFPRDHLVHVYQEAPLFRALRDADHLRWQPCPRLCRDGQPACRRARLCISAVRPAGKLESDKAHSASPHSRRADTMNSKSHATAFAPRRLEASREGIIERPLARSSAARCCATRVCAALRNNVFDPRQAGNRTRPTNRGNRQERDVPHLFSGDSLGQCAPHVRVHGPLQPAPNRNRQFHQPLRLLVKRPGVGDLVAQSVESVPDGRILRHNFLNQRRKIIDCHRIAPETEGSAGKQGTTKVKDTIALRVCNRWCTQRACARAKWRAAPAQHTAHHAHGVIPSRHPFCHRANFVHGARSRSAVPAKGACEYRHEFFVEQAQYR
jgi:MoaA/NifB/PqqE/SkfB family radical SAM enzyme